MTKITIIIFFVLFVYFTQPLAFYRNTPITEANASFIGTYRNGQAGLAISSGGDVNGDGIDDLIIGAPERVAFPSTPGAAYLIFGRESGWASDVSLSSADVIFIGEAAHDNVGSSVSINGDVNGDGIDDILIGAPHDYPFDTTYYGKAYLIFGHTGSWPSNILLSDADVIFEGAYWMDEVGACVSIIGDYNGDHICDLVISSTKFYSTPAGHGLGKDYLVVGRRETWLSYYQLDSAENSFITSDSLLMKFGTYGYSSELSRGWVDINNDSLCDLIIGTSSRSGARRLKAYVLMGKDTTFSNNTDLEEVGC